MSTDSILAKLPALSGAIAASIAVFATGGSYAHGAARALSGPVVRIHGSPVLAKLPTVPVHISPVLTNGHTLITTILRDHRAGAYRPHCGGPLLPCMGEGGLGFGEKPAQLPYGYQLPQGGQVRDHRN